MDKLNETQNKYMIIFENHVDKKTKKVFDHYLSRDIDILRKKVEHAMASRDDLSLKWLLLRYKFPKEMREFLINFIYNNSDIDESLLRPSIYFVDEAEQIVVDDSGVSRDKWNWLQDKSDIVKAYKANGEKKLVINGIVTLDELRAFLKRNWTQLNEHMQSVSSTPNYMTSRGVKIHSVARRDYRIAELSEQGLKFQDINNILVDEFPGYTVSHKDVNEIKTKLSKLRDNEYEI